MILLKIIYWIIFAICWIAIIKYRKIVYEWTGKFNWAEKYIWSWWTVIVIILIWLVLIFVSVAYPLWYIDFKPNQKIQNINTETQNQIKNINNNN